MTSSVSEIIATWSSRLGPMLRGMVGMKPGACKGPAQTGCPEYTFTFSPSPPSHHERQGWVQKPGCRGAWTGCMDGWHGALGPRDCNSGSPGNFWKAAPPPPKKTHHNSSCNTVPCSARPLTLTGPVLLDDIRKTLSPSLHAALDTSYWQGPSSCGTAAEDMGPQGSEEQMQAGSQECAWKALWESAQPSEPSL